MGKIIVDGLELYAYHGCFLEERIIGAEYKLDIWVEGDFATAEKTDDLSNTVDYVHISDIASQEMQTPSKLIENVAERILSKILKTWPNLDRAGILIKKINPPMNVRADSVQYQLIKNQ